MPGSQQYPRTVAQHDQPIRPPIQCKHSNGQRFGRMLWQMTSIDPRHLHCHDCQCRNEQDNTDPAQVCDPEEASSCRPPALVASQSNTQQQGCNGEADNPKQTCDPMSYWVCDVKAGSHRLANSSDDQKP